MGALVSGVTDILSGGAQSKAADAADKSAQQFQGLELPDIEKMKLDLQRQVIQGNISPEQAQAQLAEASKMNEIATDPRLAQAQMLALSSLQDIGQNGMDAVDRQKMEKAKSDAAQYEQGQRQAILQNANQRGVGGSGLELMAQLQAQQAGATRASQGAIDMAAQSQQNKLQALQQAGALGGQMQNTQFNQQSSIAQAQDAINKFNAQNKQQTQQFNVGNNMDAQKANLSNAQNVANTNVGIANQQQIANKSLAQQDFDNRYKKAGGSASSYSNYAQGLNQQGASTMGMLGGIGGAAIAASDEKTKTNIQELKNPSDILDALTGYKYSYKKPEMFGEGKQIGVMAQDLEKVLPQAIQDINGVKMVDASKLSGPILTMLKDQHDRIKELEKKEK
jgi:hypothetical protein